MTTTHGQAPANTNTASGAAGDSLQLCASDLRHSAIYDNHAEMQACIRAVADRIAALASAAAPAEQPVAPTEKYDDTLLPFLELMRKELHANADKGDRPGWLKMSADTALLEIYWHTAKLSAAVKNNNGPAIIEHSADVANMAMMLLDVCGGIPTAQVVPSVLEDWRLDHSAGRPILVYKDCSVIEAEQAQEVLDALRASRGQAPAGATSEPIAYLHDDGYWTPAKTTEGRKLNDRLHFAGSPKIGVYLAPTAQAAPAGVTGIQWQCGTQATGYGDQPDAGVLEDAARLERERICAAIKAEDDYCVDHGDYMLDSDDCIKIVRGEWVRPDFAITAARARLEGKP